MQSCLFSTIAGRFVDKQWVNDAKQGKVKFTDPQFVKALDFVKQLYDDGVISKSTLQLAYGEAPGLFASGKAAILIDGDWKQSSFVTDQTTGQALISPEDQKNNIELKAFPAIPGEKYPGVVSSTLGCGYGISAAILLVLPRKKLRLNCSSTFIPNLYRNIILKEAVILPQGSV